MKPSHWLATLISSLVSAGKQYLRCACPGCGNLITYPDYSAGGTSICTKCSKAVLLPAAPKNTPAQQHAAQKPAPKQPQQAPSQPAAKSPAPAPTPKPRSTAPPPKPTRRPPPAGAPRKRGGGLLRVTLWMVNLAILAAVGTVIFNRDNGEDQANANQPAAPAVQTSPPPTPPSVPEPAPTPAPAPVPAQNNPPPATPVTTPAPPMSTKPPAPAPSPMVTPPALMPEAATNAPAPTTTPPSMPTTNAMANPAMTGPLINTNGFRIAGLAIERPRGTKGSKLTYVTGLMQNIEAKKRFGVRIELNLLDRSGAKVGVATDYTAVVESMGMWRFRALVLDRRAAQVSLAGIRED